MLGLVNREVMDHHSPGTNEGRPTMIQLQSLLSQA